MSLKEQIKRLRIRIGISGLLYLGFLITVATAGSIEGDVSQVKLGIMLLLLIGSMLLLPRSAAPQGPVRRARTDDEIDAQFTERSQLRYMAKLGLYIRVFYVVIGLFVLFIVPRLFAGFI